MSEPKTTVAIIYGWAEGPGATTRFVQELESRGFRLTRDILSADIIFAHSTGCFLVPKDAKANTVVLAGLPYGPVYQMALRIAVKFFKEFMYHFRKREMIWWVRKVLFNVFYLVTTPSASYLALTRFKAENLPDGMKRRVVVIRPKEDVLMHHDTPIRLAGRGYKLIEIPGSHDSCWAEPRPYVDLFFE